MAANDPSPPAPASHPERRHPLLRCWWQRSLVAGLLFWAPLLATVWVVRTLVATMDRTPVLLPPAWRSEALLGFPLPGLGLVLALGVLPVTGIVVANLVGRRLVALYEAMLQRIPVVRSVCGAVKQLLETFFSTDSKCFRRVLPAEYPRRGVWTLAFQSGDPASKVQEKTAQDVLTLFLPTAPDPTSGFVPMVPENEVIELDMRVEEGLRMIVSLGSVVPNPAGRPEAPSAAGTPSTHPHP